MTATFYEKQAIKAPGLRDRSVSLEETFRRFEVLRERFGITRVGDTSKLDRTGVPTYCAMVPKSRDVLGVYNGKGATHLAARVSAVMEAFERQSAANYAPRTYPLSLGAVGLHLDLRRLEVIDRGADFIVECVDGTNLSTGAIVPVPLALVRFPWDGVSLFRMSTTNGLASGNNVAEAVYHALTEMIERHVWSLFHVRAEVVPRFFRGDKARDRVVAPALRFPTGDIGLDRLHEVISRQNLQLRVMMLLEGDLPPVALASVVEPQATMPMAHMGIGCSLSPAHAAERAISEAIQSRVIDMQAAREDMLRADDPDNGRSGHTRRIKEMPRDCWFVDLPASEIDLMSIADRLTNDVARDVDLLLEKLSRSGISDIVAVDISPPGQPFAAVRIVGAEFETTTVDGRIGPLGRNEFNLLKAVSLHPYRSFTT